MANNPSLQSLLQTLLGTPETKKRAVLGALLKALRETCELFRQSDIPPYQEVAGKTQKILDEILGLGLKEESSKEFKESIKISTSREDREDSVEEISRDFKEEPKEATEECEEEFVESGTFEQIEKNETQPPVVETKPLITPKAPPTSVEDMNTPEGKLAKQVSDWNKSSPSWLQFGVSNFQKPESIASFITAIAATRSNILSNNFDGQEQTLQKLDSFWQQILEILKEQGYEVKPETLEAKDPTVLSNLQGRVIYACRARSSEEESELIAPRISFQGKILREAICVTAIPLDGAFPIDHPHANFPSHWRGILGELEILIENLSVQPKVWCAVEGITKNRVESLDEYRDQVIAEAKRRGEVLKATIQKEDETIYRVATDYWRIEECFWSVFHDDDRPNGCSYLDRLRSRIQSWRTTLRRILKFHIRDFACGSDSLASVNQYIGNIIIQPRKNIAPGMVVRELRPAIMIKDQATSRLLKGRVIAT